MKQKQIDLMTRRKIFLKMWYYIKRHKLTKSQALKKAWNVHKGNDKSTGILEVWNGKRLKNVGKPNQHHYRRDGRLYTVVRTKMGLEHKLSETLYKTINNSSCRLTSRMSKNANPTRDWNMTRDYVTYHRAKEYAVC